MHLSQWPRTVQGRALAGDVETERAETEVLIRNYLLFSLLQRLTLPSKTTPKSFRFGKSACFQDLCQPLQQTHRQKHAFSHGDWVLNVVLLCLVRYTLDEFGTARRSAVVRGFIDALTRGGPGGTPRPIEMHSHDPLRYILIKSIFKIKSNFSSVENYCLLF